MIFNIDYYQQLFTLEKNCPALDFYQALIEQDILSQETDEKIKIYQDPKVYMPPEDQYDQKIHWGGLYNQIISENNPDFIILTQNKIEKYSGLEVGESSKNRNASIKEFYINAKNRSIPGYTEVYQDDFAVIFTKTKD